MIPDDEKDLSVPLTPNAIPGQGFPAASQPPRPNAENPLDFKPRSGLSYFVQVPGVILFGMVIAYLIGRYRMSVILLLLAAHVVYAVFRRRVRAFELSLETLGKEKSRKEDISGFETVEWLNYIIRKFWEVSEASVSSQIYSAVNKELRANTPKMFKSIRLTELTLGTRPPVVERIGFIDKNDDSMIIEFAVNFVPLQTSEDILYYFGEEKSHWNTCIELTAVVGFLSLPILVRNFTFSGIFRVEISLTRRIPFLKEFSLSMLDLPHVNFELQPLKTVDFMDLPYLSRAISAIIDMQVKSLLLFPKKLSIDLTKAADYRGATIGVLYAYVGGLETHDETLVSVELSIGGQAYARTAQKTGASPIFNEGFYEIVRDTTKSIGVMLQNGNERLNGRIFLRNLNKGHYTEEVHLASETARKFLRVSTRFYALTKKKTRSAIFSMALVSISNLQALGDPVNRLYTTYCMLTLETKESLRVRKVLRTFETKRIFSTKDPFYNDSFSFFVRDFNDYIVKIKVMDDKTDSVIGTVVLPLCCAEEGGANVYKIGNVESGDAEVKFGIKYVDMLEDELCEAVEDEVLGFAVGDAVPKSFIERGEQILEAAPSEVFDDAPLEVLKSVLESAGGVSGKDSTDEWISDTDSVSADIDGKNGDSGENSKDKDSENKNNKDNENKNNKDSTDTADGKDNIIDEDNKTNGDNENSTDEWESEEDKASVDAMNTKSDTNSKGTADSTANNASEECVSIAPEQLTETSRTRDRKAHEELPGAMGVHGSGKQFIRRKKSRKEKATESVEDMCIGIYNTKAMPRNVVKFTKACKFTIEEIKEPGSFYMIFETAHVNCKMEPFSTGLEINRSVIVPIRDEELIRVRLFRMVLNGDVLVSEELLRLSDTVIVFETVRVVLSMKARELVECASPEESNNLKIVQFALEQFSRPGNFAFDIFNGPAVMNYKAPCLAVFDMGAEAARCTLREDDLQRGELMLPAHCCDRRVSFADGISCRMRCYVQACDFERPTPLTSGVVELYIIKASNVRGIVDGMSSPYLKVYLNSEKVFKTGRKHRDLNPLFKESLCLDVQKNIDVLGLYICNYSPIAATTIICYKELSLFNLSEGYSKFDIQMDDGETGKPAETVLQIIFNFAKGKDGESTMEVY